MSGRGQIFVQPSELETTGGTAAGAWFRGIPTPGWVSLGGGATPAIPAVGGIATCANVISDSPPTLLEEFQVVSYSLGWAIYVREAAAPASPPTLTFEIALLVNDRVQYVASEQTTGIALAGVTTDFVASDHLTSDLVNPVTVGARDRLGLRIGGLCNQATTIFGVMIGAQLTPSPTFDSSSETPFESTVSFNVIDLPGSRRL